MSASLYYGFFWRITVKAFNINKSTWEHLPNGKDMEHGWLLTKLGLCIFCYHKLDLLALRCLDNTRVHLRNAFFVPCTVLSVLCIFLSIFQQSQEVSLPTPTTQVFYPVHLSDAYLLSPETSEGAVLYSSITTPPTSPYKGL